MTIPRTEPGLVDSETAPSVSVVLPTHTERRYLRDCLDSLLAQDYPAVREILVVDGGSVDGTRELADAEGGIVRLLDNPRVTAAAAMNVGIEAARGAVIVRADAHALYAPDYVTRCVHTLLETGADNVGGRMVPVGTTNFGRAIAATTSMKAGVGNGAFHYAGERQEVDTVFLGCWWRDTLETLGGYDEESLQWAAEDHELNYRLTEAGGRIVLDPKIRSVYFPRPDPRSLARQYHNYGIGKASTLAKHGSLPTLRPLAPAGLVGAAAIATVAARGPFRLAVPFVHALYCAKVGWSAGSDGAVAPHRAAAAVAIMHWSYGTGFWRGIVRAAAGRPFDNRPQGHR
ncbi:MAG: glycosyltransferase family 2 protein [Acidimicrobiales bacterium]|nr:glycosyltransferase family 2 protein [Acidimicrobiales bacterium]